MVRVGLASASLWIKPVERAGARVHMRWMVDWALIDGLAQTVLQVASIAISLAPYMASKKALHLAEQCFLVSFGHFEVAGG